MRRNGSSSVRVFSSPRARATTRSRWTHCSRSAILASPVRDCCTYAIASCGDFAIMLLARELLLPAGKRTVQAQGGRLTCHSVALFLSRVQPRRERVLPRAHARRPRASNACRIATVLRLRTQSRQSAAHAAWLTSISRVIRGVNCGGARGRVITRDLR